MKGDALGGIFPHPADLKLDTCLRDFSRLGLSSAGSALLPPGLWGRVAPEEPPPLLAVAGAPCRCNGCGQGSTDPSLAGEIQHSSNTAERDLGEMAEHGKNTKQQHNRMLIKKKNRSKKKKANVKKLFWAVRASTACVRRRGDNPPRARGSGVLAGAQCRVRDAALETRANWSKRRSEERGDKRLRGNDL